MHYSLHNAPRAVPEKSGVCYAMPLENSPGILK